MWTVRRLGIKTRIQQQVAVPAPASGGVIATPPDGAATLPPSSHAVAPSLTETEAAELARAEAYRHGWRNITVERAALATDRWHVDLYHEPEGKKVRGWADIASDGKVLSFSQTPDNHDALDAHR